MRGSHAPGDRSPIMTLALSTTILATTLALVPAPGRGAAAAGSRESLLLSVRTFGATGDGRTLDTDAVNRTIQAAAAAGGGRRLVPRR